MRNGVSLKEIELKDDIPLKNRVNVAEVDDQEMTTLLASSDSIHQSDELRKRTGTTWSAVAHIITGVIGAGVLSLAWSIAQLGWVAGPLIVVVFAAITVVSTDILCNCYRSPDPEYGPIRNPSLMEAVKFYLGEKSQRACGIFLLESLYGCAVAYTIAVSDSVRAIQRASCYHKEGHQAICGHNDYIFSLSFGLVQIVVSQIQDFHNMVWLSIVAAVMSFSYSFIGVGLGLAKVIENGEFLGSISGAPASSTVNKIWLVFEALGDIAFAFPYSVIVLEIQDTLKSPPPEVHTMKKASLVSIVTTTFFYLCCGCFGYAAFGKNTPGNLLTGFGFYEPYWLVGFANACIILHLVGGYRVYSQPVFELVEKWFSKRYPDNAYAKDINIQMPCVPDFSLNIFRLCFRTLYVVSTTGIALLFPYFNQVLGVLGAFNFWPMSIYFPFQMYFVQQKIGVWTRKWVVLQIFSIICLAISIVGFMGSVQRLISAKFS